MQARELRALSRELVRELGLLAPSCCGAPITPVEAHLLMELETQPLSNHQLAERLRVDKSNTSRPLRRLQERELVSGEPHPHDGRRQQLSLSPQGQALLRGLHADLDAQSDEVLSLLSVQEQQQLTLGLQHYLRALRQHRAQQGYRLRPLTPEDQASLAAIIRSVSAEYGLTADRGYGVADPWLDRLHEYFATPRSGYWVVEDAQGQLLGGGGIAPLRGGDDTQCELQKIYFLPTGRGKGLGRRLVLQAIAFAREAGYRYCYLESTAALARATRLYEELGFVHLTAPLGNTGHCDCEIRMVLDLEDADVVPTPTAPGGCGCPTGSRAR